MVQIQRHKLRIAVVRALANRFKMGQLTAKDAVVEVECVCGCGDSMRIRADKLGAGDVFLSNRRDNRKQCLAKMPVFHGGKVIRLYRQKGDRMVGVRWLRSPWHRAVKAWFLMVCLRCAAWLS